MKHKKKFNTQVQLMHMGICQFLVANPGVHTPSKSVVK